MKPERWQEVEKIFQSALERAPGLRTAFLDEACAGDEFLRQEVESLIAADQEAGEFIEASAIEAATGQLRRDQSGSMIGQLVGSYRIIRELGRGGMGKVLLACQDEGPNDYRVAIKLIKRGMDSDHITLRFNHERQILATLDHPNIARLLDGGTTDDGAPYFVMEYIEGKRLIDYCDALRLNTTERLKLLQSICSAVQYAHQNNIVHRDIKPSNILVTSNGIAKLLDFGIAKLLRPDPTMETIALTPPGMRLMTLDYASPEQVKGETITPSSDIYSLGVVLYEVLTGHRPYRVKSDRLEETIRAICEQQPEKPSLAVTRVEEVITTDSRGRVAITPESVCSTREDDPDKLRRRLEGDLDNIVIKALHKEAHARYDSVEHLSGEIRRHLEGSPVIPRKDSLGSTASRTGTDFGDGLKTSVIHVSDLRALVEPSTEAPVKIQIACWREVRSHYQRCADILEDLRSRALLAGSDAEDLEQITRSIDIQIAKCDAALAKLKAR
jgi:serine/threonine protein kinase